MAVLNGMGGIETTEFMMSKVDDFGTPDAYNHYAVGWAHALCTPYQWTKQIASHWGGTRNGTIVHWPKGLSDKGTVRDQFHHVIDVAPTILEAAGIPAPLYVKGIQQAPLEGVSMLPTLRDTAAPESHVVQYFEILGNRGSTTTAGRRVPNTARPGCRTSHHRSTPTSGSSTDPTTGPSPATWPPRSRTNWPSCNGFGLSRR